MNFVSRHFLFWVSALALSAQIFPATDQIPRMKDSTDKQEEEDFDPVYYTAPMDDTINWIKIFFLDTSFISRYKSQASPPTCQKDPILKSAKSESCSGKPSVYLVQETGLQGVES